MPPSSLNGLAIARERIAKEAEEKTGALDLGMLGLTELPEELFRLKHLRRLNLGDRYPDAQGNWHHLSKWYGKASAWVIGENSVGNDIARLGELDDFQSLWLRVRTLSNLAPLAGLSSLELLDCSTARVRDLTPVAGLSNLRSLNCSFTQVSNLAPVARLSNLQTLDCSSTQVSNLAPVAGLSRPPAGAE